MNTALKKHLKEELKWLNLLLNAEFDDYNIQQREQDIKKQLRKLNNDKRN